jgi:hypothetical protein
MVITLEIDESTMSVIRQLEEASGKSKGDVILDALRLYDWARQQYQDGLSVGAISGGRAIKEVDLPLKRSPSTKQAR